MYTGNHCLDLPGQPLKNKSLDRKPAVLGTKEPLGEWSAKVLSSYHNGDNPAEANKVREQHPGEPQSIYDNRVLGAIAVTRAIGDFSFKLPAVYTERVFLNANPGFEVPDKVRSFIGRNITPPYMSGVPEVQHVELVQGTSSFLLMCSDGLMDLYEDQRLEFLSKKWVSKVGKDLKKKKKGNLALSVLREALGGEDEEKVSCMLTVEMFFKWMDDTTILVQMTNNT